MRLEEVAVVAAMVMMAVAGARVVAVDVVAKEVKEVVSTAVSTEAVAKVV